MKIASFTHPIRDSLILLQQFLQFIVSGKNSDLGYQKMINLYCFSNGYSNKILSTFNGLIKKINKSNLEFFNLDIKNSILDWKDDLNEIVAKLEIEGYVVLNTKLSSQICEELIKFAEITPCLPSGDSQRSANQCIYNRKHPIAPTYKFMEIDLAENSLIQNLAADPYFIKIASKYLRTAPVLDLIAMWWSTSFKKEADVNSAQMYHFDMDRLRWLKVFFYLTDVDSDTGAHCYISQSHQPGQKPKEIRRRGYARIPDEDLRRYYPNKNFCEITGKAGTIIIGDTMAYHKGKPLQKGHRLILEFEYADSLFGAPLQKIFIKKPSSKFVKLKKDYHGFFGKFNFQ
jgi:hypothetical protein